MKITHLPFDNMFKVTWRYGAKSTIGGTRDGTHHGIDLVGVTSKNVFATSEGIVEFAGFDPSGFGNYVKIVDSKNNLWHYFAHLDRIDVKVGQQVTYTTRLGIMGKTGNVTGPHTHYEIRKNGKHIDPTPYMGIPNVEGSYNSNNYLIDPNPSPVTVFKVRIDKAAANVRTEPNTNGAFVTQPSGKAYLVKGDVFNAIDVITGQYVDGSDKWFKSAKGNYVHSYGLTRI